MSLRSIEIMDTTLRDGEQTSGVSFSVSEKLTLAKLLLQELCVDRIEIASARVSKGEFQAVKQISQWAKESGYLQAIEVLTFVDGGRSLQWMQDSGVKVQNLLTKGSLHHLTYQLKKKPPEHFNDIAQNIKDAKSLGITTNIYLEDWSNGMLNSKAYVLDYLDFISKQDIKRVLLPDTLGILTPDQTKLYFEELVGLYPDMHFDFHGHNDYDLAVANVMQAVRAGAKGLHLTLNGMGERAGNAPMASVIAMLSDYVKEVKTNINEASLYKVSKLCEAFSGFMIPVNKPIVGENVFTQTAGIHADGDNKKNLYYNDLLPERFKRKRRYALGKTSGKANIQKNLQELGLVLNDDDLKKVTQAIIELGDKKEVVTQDDLPYIISDVLDQGIYPSDIQIESFLLTHAKGLSPSATIVVRIKDQVIEKHAQGDGQYDAFMNALRIIFKEIGRSLPKLVDYAVRIPPSSNSDALCETIITWELEDQKTFLTRGLDSDQTVSAIKATEKMLNRV